MNPEVSFIVTVFNKAKALPNTIHSILRQSNNINCEYIFIDDASTDDSITVIEREFEGSPNFTILKNDINKGPSIRLNQGCEAAKGKFLFLIDADDILAASALEIMLSHIKSENADFVFGSSKVLECEQKSLLDIKLSSSCTGAKSITPLDTVLGGRYVRMSYLVTKELYSKSTGANEKIFIQDESLPLSLAYNAGSMVTLTEAAVYSAAQQNSLSTNKSQLIHDRFYAYYYALLEFKNLSDDQRKLMYIRAISSVWKAKRITPSLLDKLFFITYIKTKIFLPKKIEAQDLDKYRNFMDNLKNVRKIL